MFTLCVINAPRDVPVPFVVARSPDSVIFTNTYCVPPLMVAVTSGVLWTSASDRLIHPMTVSRSSDRCGVLWASDTDTTTAVGVRARSEHY